MFGVSILRSFHDAYAVSALNSRVGRLTLVLAAALTLVAGGAWGQAQKADRAKVHWLDQNWSNQDRFWFHHATQGTSTLPMPYDWFVALQQPGLTGLSAPKMLSDPAYLKKFGFIPSPRTLQTSPSTLARFGYSTAPRTTSRQGPAVPISQVLPARLSRRQADNIDGLPVGFARTPGYRDPTTGQMLPDQIGFTCAACHTGELRYKDTSILFDGGAAMVDLLGFQKAMVTSLALTAKLRLRFKLFADRVLGQDRSKAESASLKRQVGDLVTKLLNAKEHQERILANRKKEHVIEGFGRLDALNRIGNQMFWTNLLPAAGKPGRPYFTGLNNSMRREKLGFDVDDNFSHYTAPVSFPPIWTSPWNLWAQYDGSILQPIIRNAGEALGVAARINLTNTRPGARPLFHSSVDMRDLRNIEDLLAGPDPWKGEKGFKGLAAPRWSDAARLFPGDAKWQLDPAKVDKGRLLYAEICAECHLPPVRDPAYPPPNAKSRFGTSSLWDENTVTKCFETGAGNGASAQFNAAGGPPKVWCETKGRRYLMVTMKRAADMKTDDAAAKVLAERTIKLPGHLRINPDVDMKEWNCGPIADEEPEMKFGPALMATVERVAQQWFRENPRERADRDSILGGRRNCPNRQPGPLYRARTLEGIWATAPFLHNGSVPNLWALLSPDPEKDRPKVFCVGSKSFDPDKVGMASACKPGTDDKCECANGSDPVNTAIPGNHNGGHLFTADTRPEKVPTKEGVVGRKLSEAERHNLIAYLKSL